MLIHVGYSRVPSSMQSELRHLFFKLCADETPMVLKMKLFYLTYHSFNSSIFILILKSKVRRVAASYLWKLLDEVDSSHVTDFIEPFSSLANDDQVVLFSFIRIIIYNLPNN